MRSIYAEKALEEIPRLLSSLDRNPFSPTYGCFSREYWLTRVRDFPDAIAQFGTLSLALISKNQFPGGEGYYQNKEILAWTIAGIKYWIKIQHRDGSYDEFYPNERGWAGPTGFLLYAMLRSYELLGNAFPKELKEDFFKAVRRSAWFLATRDESGVLANHHAMALLPIYQSRHHFIKEDPEFAKQLLIKFEERLEVFLSYHNDEGWSLEYDGIDPGYLSATVSFLSKMQKYMDGSETWKSKIENVITQSVDTLSYFFYPNGSYAGTIGSRQTLHFYAHGCELQSKNNPVAAACAAFGQKSLTQGKLVPPGIQDDRYYLYRIPEFLEAYTDGRDYADTPSLPHQKEPFEKYFEKAKMFIRNTPNHYILLNMAKGGVLKVYDKNKNNLVFADDGIIASLSDKKVLTSQWIGPEYNIDKNGNQIVVSGNLHKIPFQYFNPITMIGFRVFMILAGWNAKLADIIKGVIRDLLMTRSSKAPISFERRFTFKDDEVTIDNTIITNKNIASLRLGGQFAARYVPQSRYFQQEELQNDCLKISSGELGEINKTGRVTFSRTVSLN